MFFRDIPYNPQKKTVFSGVFAVQGYTMTSLHRWDSLSPPWSPCPWWFPKPAGMIFQMEKYLVKNYIQKLHMVSFSKICFHEFYMKTCYSSIIISKWRFHPKASRHIFQTTFLVTSNSMLAVSQLRAFRWTFEDSQSPAWSQRLVDMMISTPENETFQEISNRTHWTDPWTWVSDSSIATYLGVRW